MHDKKSKIPMLKKLYINYFECPGVTSYSD